MEDALSRGLVPPELAELCAQVATRARLRILPTIRLTASFDLSAALCLPLATLFHCVLLPLATLFHCPLSRIDPQVKRSLENEQSRAVKPRWHNAKAS